jgi:DNA-binding NtrC family response regulator
VESAVGVGTTFSIYLPQVDALQAPAGDAAASRAIDRTAARETILLVEDDDTVREYTRRALHRAGYTVVAARNGGEAMLIAGRHDGRIHLLITDVVMPFMNGRELAAHLTEHRRDMRVLFMSGYPDGEIARRGVEDGTVALLEKPFTVRDLLERTRDCLNDAPAAA